MGRTYGSKIVTGLLSRRLLPKTLQRLLAELTVESVSGLSIAERCAPRSSLAADPLPGSVGPSCPVPWPPTSHRSPTTCIFKGWPRNTLMLSGNRITTVVNVSVEALDAIFQWRSMRRCLWTLRASRACATCWIASPITSMVWGRGRAPPSGPLPGKSSCIPAGHPSA